MNQTVQLVPAPAGSMSLASTRALAAAGGAFAGLCWLPFGLAPFLPVALAITLVALRRAGSPREAVWLGVTIGVARYAVAAHFLLALLRYSPLAIVFYAMTIVFIVPFAILESWGAYALERRAGVPRAVGFIALWTVGEKLRTIGEMGFPADLVSHCYGTAPAFLSLAPWIGPTGQTLIVGAAAILLERAVHAWPDRRRAAAWGAAAAVVALAPCAGEFAADPPAAAARSLRVGIVQPSTSIEDKLDASHADVVWDSLVRLTRTAASGADLVLWPETARPKAAVLRSGRLEDPEVAAIAKDVGVPILYGTIIWEVEGREVVALYNGAALAQPDGTIAQWYGKQRLLPFVEAVPYGRYVGLDPRARAKAGPRRGYLGVLGNFTPGPEPTLFEVGGARIGVMICFEGIVPEVARTYRNAGANALAVLTNDVWWGRSVFPRWHANMIAARAREVGLPVLRAANNGISSSTGADGTMLAHSELFEVTSLRVPLQPTDPPRTLYVRWGDWPIDVVVAGLGVALLRGTLQRRRRNRYDDDPGLSPPRAA